MKKNKPYYFYQFIFTALGSLYFFLVVCTPLIASTNPYIFYLKKRMPSKHLESISFKDMPLAQLVDFFSTQFNLNIISKVDLEGDVQFNFSNIHPIDAFHSVLSSKNLDWYVEKNVIYIHQSQPVKVFKLKHVPVKDIEANITQNIGNAKLSINELQNSFIVQGPAETLKAIERLVWQLDVAPQQVFIEVKVLELQKNKQLDSGINNLEVDLTLKQNTINPTSNQSTTTNTNSTQISTASDIGQSSGSSASGLIVNIINKDMTHVLTALKSSSDFEVIATPKLLTLNNKRADIITGQRLGYKSQTFTPATGTGNASYVNESVEFLEVGTKLGVTPHILDNNTILLEIIPELSDGSIVDGLPQEFTTKTNTNVKVKNGQTIVIGGLIRESKSKSRTGVPILSDIPFLNMFFSKTSNIVQRKEMVILLTPRLITDDMINQINATVPKH